MEIRSKHRLASLRHGLSFVEFVGCLVSMSGGVVLGSFYLGIDMQTMAIGVLEQAQVVAPGYFDHLQPQSAEAADEESLATADREHTVAANDLDTGNSSATGESEPYGSSTSEPDRPITKPVPTKAERTAATRAYWDGLTACMLAEAQGRLGGSVEPADWQIHDYLAQRKRGHEAALAALEKLATSGVDGRLLSHGEQVIAWHKSGVELFGHLLSLLSDSPGSKLTGPFAQTWQTAATQLRMEENLVVERHNAVANYLDREYDREAPFIPAYKQK